MFNLLANPSDPLFNKSKYVMRNIIQTLSRFSLLVLLLFIGASLSAQTPDNPFHTGTSADEVFSWYTGLYSGALIVLTRLQAVLFPRAGSVPKVGLRYIIIAAVVGALFITLGFTNAWGIVIGFVGAALSYDKGIEPLSSISWLSWLKTPKPV